MSFGKCDDVLHWQSGGTSDLRTDFDFLCSLKSLVVKDVEAARDGRASVDEESVKLGVYRHTSDGRSYRTVYPNGLDTLMSYLLGKSDSVFFVGFIGYKKNIVSDKINELIWSMDKMLIEELGKHECIMAYISCERYVGGNYGNLVLFTKEEAVNVWSKSDLHQTVVKDVSPKYYTNVRIHGGRLAKGIIDEQFTVERTIFIDYETDGQITRRVHKWGNIKI